LGLAQLTTITGIYGLSFLSAGFNALLTWTGVSNALTPRARMTCAAAATAMLLSAVLVGPRLVPQPQAHHFARAVQLNFPEVDSYPTDWFQVHAADLDEIVRLSLAPAAEKPDLLVWPEAPGRRVFVYDTIHLVPFGEYEPFPLIHRVVASVSGQVGGFYKGNKYVVGQLPGGNRFGVFICYEAIFPGEVRRFAANGAQVFINISNDGWFGRSAAAEQHLRMARVRAVENRRWLVRSTNNGFTVSVDPYGRFFEPIPPDTRTAADLPYDFRTDETIYTRFGDWFAWLCVLVSVILVAATFRKAK